MASHVLALHNRMDESNTTAVYSKDGTKKEIIDLQRLRRYIAYARSTVVPIVNSEARSELISSFVQFRGQARRA